MATFFDGGSVRWGILGCGAVTEVKSGPAYRDHPEFELAMVMRRDGEKAADYAMRHGVARSTDDADVLIHDPGIDAVYIATPPDTHRDFALRVAEAGKACCVEKPMAPDYDSCLVMCEAFESRDLPLYVAYYRRSLPRFLQVRDWIQEGAIGDVRHVSWHKAKPPSDLDLRRTAQWRTDPAVAPGGYFDDLASHGLDLFAFLLGQFTEVHGVAVNQQGLYGAKDAIAATWLHEGGVTGSGYWNFGLERRIDRAVIEGSKGAVVFSVLDEHPLELHRGERVERREIAHPAHIQEFHVARLADDLIRGEGHPSTGRTAAHTAWAMDQILGKGR